MRRDASSKVRPRAGHKWRRRALAALCFAALLVCAHAAAEWLAARALRARLLGLDEARAAGVSLGEVRVRLRREVRVELVGLTLPAPTGVRVSGALVRVERVVGSVPLVELLRRGEQALDSARVTVERPAVALPLDPDGRAALARAVNTWVRSASRRTGTRPPGAPRSTRVPFASIEVRGGSLALSELGVLVATRAGRGALDGLALAVTRDADGEGFALTLRGALFGLADGLRGDARVSRGALRHAHLRVERTPTGALRRALGSGDHRWANAVETVAFAVDAGPESAAHERPVTLSATIETNAAAQGRTLRLDGTGLLRAQAGELALRGVEASLGDDVRVAAEGTLRQLAQGGSLEGSARVVEGRAERWLAALELLRGAPLPVRAQGPFALEVRATAATAGEVSALQARVALSEAEVAYEDVRKPAGVALEFTARGAFGPLRVASISEAELRVADASLTLRDARFSSPEQRGSFTLRVPSPEALFALAPVAARALAQRGVTLPRGGQVTGSFVRRNTGYFSIDGAIALDRVRAALGTGGRARVEGALAARFSVEQQRDAARAERDGLRVRATLDLGAAALTIGGAYAHPAGVPWALTVNATHHANRGARWELEAVELRTRGARLSLAGWVDPRRRAFELTQGHALLALGELAATVPALAPARLPALLREGHLEARARARGTLGGQVEATLDLGDARARGGHGSGRVALSIAGGRTHASVQLDGEARTREAGALGHVQIRLQIERDGEAIRVREGALTAPGVRLAGGELDARVREGELAVRAPTLQLDADALAAWAGPAAALPARLRGTRAQGSLEARVRRDALHRAQARLYGLDLRGPFGDLSGEIALVDAFPFSRVRFALRSEHLTLDAPRAAGARAPAPSPAPTAPPESTVPRSLALPVWTRLLRAEGSLDVAELAAGGATLRAVHAEASVGNLRLAFDRLRFSLGGGAVTADDSWVDLGARVPSARIRARSTSWLSLERALPRTEGERGPDAGAPGPSGLVFFDVDLTGAGADAESFRASLRGPVEISAHDLRFAPPERPRVRVTNAQIARLLERRSPSGTPSPAAPPADPRVHLAWLRARVELTAEGVRTREPVDLLSDFGAATLTGTVSTDRRVALEGTLLLDPEALARRSNDRLVAAEAIAVPMRVTRSEPGVVDIELLDVPGLVRAMVVARLRALIAGPPRRPVQ